MENHVEKDKHTRRQKAAELMMSPVMIPAAISFVVFIITVVITCELIATLKGAKLPLVDRILNGIDQFANPYGSCMDPPSTMKPPSWD